MNEPLLDSPVSELAVLPAGAGTDGVVPDVVLTADQPIVEIPGVGTVFGTPGEGWVAFWQCFMRDMVEREVNDV